MKTLNKSVLLLLVATTSLAQVNTANNTTYGVQAGNTLQNGGGSGTNNAFFGAYAGQLVSSGNQNTLIGIQTGRKVSTGAANTFLGFGAGQNTTAGNFNTFIGANAGVNNTEGSSNFFLERVWELKRTGSGVNFVVAKQQSHDQTVETTDRLPVGRNFAFFQS